MSILSSYWGNLKSNVDAQTLFVAIVGWLFALLLQRSNTKRQHRFTISYDIYNQFIDRSTKIQSAITGLSSCAVVTPFILMDSALIPFQLNLSSLQSCLDKGRKYWSDHLGELSAYYSDFSKQYLSLLNLFDYWQGTFGPLLKAKDVLTGEIQSSDKKIHDSLTKLRGWDIQYGSDWRVWKHEDIKKELSIIAEESNAMGQYLDDFVGLIHNQLLAKYFKHKRPQRKTLVPEYRVLTKKGIRLSLNKKLIKKMKNFKLAHDFKIREYFSQQKQDGALADEMENRRKGICPECKQNIQVISLRDIDNTTIFFYICGHGWKCTKT